MTTCTECYCFSFQHILPSTCLCPILLSAVLGNYPMKKLFFKILIVFLCPKSIWSRKKTFTFTEVWILGTWTNQTHSFDLPHTCTWERWVVVGSGVSKRVLVPQGRHESEKFLTHSAKDTENQRVIIKSVFLGHHKIKHQAHQVKPPSPGFQNHRWGQCLEAESGQLGLDGVGWRGGQDATLNILSVLGPEGSCRQRGGPRVGRMITCLEGLLYFCMTTTTVTWTFKSCYRIYEGF